MPSRKNKRNVTPDKKKEVFRLLKKFNQMYQGKSRRPDIPKEVGRVLGLKRTTVFKIQREMRTGKLIFILGGHPFGNLIIW